MGFQCEDLRSPGWGCTAGSVCRGYTSFKFLDWPC